MYISIQRARFGDRISFALITDEYLPDVPVPALIIQPLIENAIMHGTFDKIGLSHIDVVVRADDTAVHICVLDDGIGMSAPELSKVFESDKPGAGPPENIHGIGLSNLKERLSMFAEGRNDISISSVYRSYFRVDITIGLAQFGGDGK
jgi:sensor histidine kinase YesM